MSWSLSFEAAKDISVIQVDSICSRHLRALYYYWSEKELERIMLFPVKSLPNTFDLGEYTPW